MLFSFLDNRCVSSRKHSFVEDVGWYQMSIVSIAKEIWFNPLNRDNCYSNIHTIILCIIHWPYSQQQNRKHLQILCRNSEANSSDSETTLNKYFHGTTCIVIAFIKCVYFVLRIKEQMFVGFVNHVKCVTLYSLLCKLISF